MVFVLYKLVFKCMIMVLRRVQNWYCFLKKMVRIWSFFSYNLGHILQRLCAIFCKDLEIFILQKNTSSSLKYSSCNPSMITNSWCNCNIIHDPKSQQQQQYYPWCNIILKSSNNIHPKYSTKSSNYQIYKLITIYPTTMITHIILQIIQEPV